MSQTIVQTLSDSKILTDIEIEFQNAGLFLFKVNVFQFIVEQNDSYFPSCIHAGHLGKAPSLDFKTWSPSVI